MLLLFIKGQMSARKSHHMRFPLSSVLILCGKANNNISVKRSRINNDNEQNRAKALWKQGLYYCCSRSPVLLLALRCLSQPHLSWCAALLVQRRSVLRATPGDDALRAPMATFRFYQLPNNISLRWFPFQSQHGMQVCTHLACILAPPCEPHLKLGWLKLYYNIQT